MNTNSSERKKSNFQHYNLSAMFDFLNNTDNVNDNWIALKNIMLEAHAIHIPTL